MPRLDSEKGGASDEAFFGHPRGLGYLAFTEVWEGFSYYGMQALLVLYMVGELLTPGHAENVIALAGLRAAMEARGTLTTIAAASQIFGIYAALVNATPLIGGWLGDRILGQTRTIVLGAVMMIGGHLALMSEALFIVGLLLLAFGAGFVKGNMAVQIGRLYGADDPRRARGFAVYMFVRNLGAFSAPLICGTLGETLGWHYGFGVAALTMAAALVIYLSGRRYLPPEPPLRRRGEVAHRLDDGERRAIVGLLLAFVPYLLMFTAAYQAYNLLPIWVSQQVDRGIGGWTMPVTWLFTFDGISTMLGIVLTMRLWRELGQRGCEPGDLLKLAVGGAMTSAAFLLLGLGAMVSPGLVAIVWVFGFFLLLDFSFIWGEPPLRAFVSAHAPPTKAALMMSLSIMCIALANFIVGWLGRFYEPLGATHFWLLHAAIAAAGAVSALVLRPSINRLVQKERA